VVDAETTGFSPTTHDRIVDAREPADDLSTAAAPPELQNAHSAAADALATAQLLSLYLETARFGPLCTTRSRAPNHTNGLPIAHCREARTPRPSQWLDGVVARMPRAADPKVDTYLGVLEEALLDGFLSEAEKTALYRSPQNPGSVVDSPRHSRRLPTRSRRSGARR
jgi:DNA polymerase III epsilon subunit-like protein